MNKLAIGGIIAAIVVGGIAIFAINLMSGNTNDTDLQATDQNNSISRPAVQAVPNTFSIMTPEEKAAAEEAARIEAELAAQASSSATTTASSTIELSADDTEFPVDTTN